MRKAMAAAAAALLATAAAGKAPAEIKVGVDAWSRGDFAAAVRAWEGPAAAGDADAQFNLAQAYKFGRGVPASLAKAEELYRKAAAQGHILAADNYGLLLFQSGRRKQAMAWIVPSAERGEARAQYVLGIAHFNGDLVPADPVRAYALMLRAAAAGLAPAKAGLTTMDETIPLEQRQQAAALAAELEQRAKAVRTAQFAAADLGGKGKATDRRTVAPIKVAVAPAAKPANWALRPEPVTAGADFAHPVPAVPVAAVVPAKPARPAAAPAALRADTTAARLKSAPVKPIATPPRVAAVSPSPALPIPVKLTAAGPAVGSWRVQLGAFAVRGNAEALWTRLAGRSALAGREGSFVPAGHLTRLLAGPFASKAEAQAACTALAGQACMVVAD